jgi:dolichyl-phosphate-mannose-protein mannosyltransferase
MPGQDRHPVLIPQRGVAMAHPGASAPVISRPMTAGTSAELAPPARWSDPNPATLPMPAVSRVASKYELLRSWWLLPAILVVQAALSIRLIWANTAFQDESLYLWAGHLELMHWLHGSYVPPFATYFSGAPVLYPPLAALASSAGGLAAARLLSLGFMIVATVLLYATAKLLFSRGPALAAAALFATFGLGSQLGAFATYDAMALCLMALAAWLTVRATGRFSEVLLVLAAVSLALANATKYASVLWDPVIVALAVASTTQASQLLPRPARWLRACRIAAYVALLDEAALYHGGALYRQGIGFTTFSRQIVTGTAPLKIIDIAWGWLALLLLLGLIGVLLIWLDSKRVTALPLVLFAAALLAPAEQARISDITSLHKHVVFGAWFLCIVAGYAVTKISQLDGQLSHGVIIGTVLIAAFATTGFSQAASVSRSWPAVNRVMPALGTAINQAGCPCLVLQLSAARYYLPASDLTGTVIGPYTFTYRDSANWAPLSGTSAMAAAISNGYFGAVQVDASRGLATYHRLVASLRRSGQYRLIAAQPWGLHPAAPTQVWERTTDLRP